MRMKLTLLLTFAVIHCASAVDCISTSRTHYVDGWEEADSRQLIHEPVTAGATVSCSFFPDSREKLNVRVREETGTYNGIGYRIFHADGSGVIQGDADVPFNHRDYENNWALRCRLDVKQVPQHCILKKKDVMVRRDTQGVFSVSVGANREPGSEMLIRIDRNWAISASGPDGFSKEQTATILSQMKSGQQMDTRYRESSKQWKTDKTMTLFGFKQALDIMKIVMERIVDH